MIVIGGVTDQTIYLAWSQISGLFSISNPRLANFFPYKYYFRNLLNPLVSNQPLSALVLSFSLSLFGKNGFNILILLTVLANIIISYLYFKKFKYGFVYTILFSLSSYFWIHLGIHIALMQIWVFPLFFYALSKSKEFNIRSAVFVGLLLGVITTISNYYGFFLLVFFSTYVFINIIVEFIYNKSLLKKFFQFYVMSILVALISVLMFLVPYFKSQYFSPKVMEQQRMERTLEDFITFSSRPWYFITLPVKNPIFGGIGSMFISRLESTGYFLADDYFPSEHSGNYFGIFFTVSLLTIFIYVLVKGEKNIKKEVIVLGLVVVAVFLAMMPPLVTISGLKIYTPGFLIYKFLPMFRVTARMGILLLVVLLTIFAICFDFILKVFKDKEVVLRNFLFLVLVITILEVFVPPKVFRYDKAPEVYSYLGEVTSKESRFAIYPYHKTQEAVFWIPIHERSLVNIRDYTHGDFSAENLTKALNTTKGLEELKELGTDYLVVCKSVEPKDKIFFDESHLLELSTELKDYFVYTVRR